MKLSNVLTSIAIIGAILGSFGSMNIVSAMDNKHQPGPGSIMPVGGKHEPVFGHMSSAKSNTPQVNNIAKALNLSVDQITQVQAIITGKELIVQPLKQKIALDHSQIAAAAIILPYDETAVTTLVNQLGADVASLAAAEAKAQNQIYSILTTDQQALFVKISDFFHGMLE